MSKSRGAYPPEFRRQMVELVRAGRTPEELAGEFELTYRQADRADAGGGNAAVSPPPFLRRLLGRLPVLGRRRQRGAQSCLESALRLLWCKVRIRLRIGHGWSAEWLGSPLLRRRCLSESMVAPEVGARGHF
jgi:hypothetical protein